MMAIALFLAKAGQGTAKGAQGKARSPDFALF
jgi:hypothetical protein